MNGEKLTPITNKPSLWALSPLLVFLCLYLVTSIIVNDFYKVPITIAFMVSSVYAVCITKGLSLNERMLQYSIGAANKNIMLMIWIFILAGAFAQSAKDIGAIDATVNLTLLLLPDNLLLAGIFLAACFISLSIGTSVGTIVALVPVAAGIAEKTDMNLAFMTGIVVGGAFFGDNLSFISDTTIAATRTQGCEMGDKFRMNFLIVLPAALLTVALLWFSASGGTEVTLHDFELIRVLPYIAVLVLALTGLNAFIVLATGILLSGLVGLFCGIPGADGQIVPYSLLRWGQDIYKGFTGMNEIMVLSMLIGGLGELIRYHGGIAWLLARVDGLARRLAGKSGGKGSSRVGESCIALLASLADICTANNTVAIILTGGLAREIALKNGIDPRRSASLLDIFSCVFQGLIPWAAQLLLAGSLAKISPPEITINNWYCMLLAVAGILAIILGLPRIKARSTEA